MSSANDIWQHEQRKRDRRDTLLAVLVAVGIGLAAVLTSPAQGATAPQQRHEWHAVRTACTVTFEGWERMHGRKLETFVRRGPTEIHGTIRWDNGTRAEIIVRSSEGLYCVTDSKFLGREAPGA